MTDPFLVLGAAVVKSGLRIWLKDDSFAADTSNSVIDLIKSKIAGELEQRQAQRFFEDLEVPVANRLRGLRSAEFGNMPVNEWTAAVLAAGQSFDHARLSPQDLFARDLDPLSLEQQMRSDRDSAIRDLSADATAFYDRMISEACAYVIEIADKLPQFQVGAFSELLQRDRQILRLISHVLDRIPQETQGEPVDARFTTAYVRHLATKLDRLELFGLDFESPWYPLSMAYISLRTGEQGKSGNQKSQNIEDVLASNSRTVIFGRAGSGKTTVLQWAAVRAARSDFPGSLSDLNGHIPFFVRLREYVGKELPPPEEFILSIAPMLAPEMPQGWASAHMREGQTIVLIDGADELPANERGRVSSWLQDLIELFPDNRYVVTSRPAAVSANWLDELSFARTSLEAMPPPLVEAFVKHWHEAACDRLAESEDRERIRDYERSLLSKIRDNRYLRELSDTPLLAGLLCALNRHLSSQLPHRRSEIYARALTMFDQRDRTREIVTSGTLLDLEAKTHLLASLAIWMVRNGESEIEVQTAISVLNRSMTSLPSTSDSGDVIFQALLERSGLLREPAAGHVDFVHRTFQEYLAAWASVNEDAIRELVRNAHDDQWREVLLMAAGQANRPQSEQLLRGLLERSRRGTGKIRYPLLAVVCLQEIRSVDLEVRRQVEDMIPSLLPPRSMEQAEQLSSAGEGLIPVLAQHWWRELGRAPETIRAASLVGGPEALDLIKQVFANCGNEDSALRAEIARAWQYFDADDYARHVLVPARPEELVVENGPKHVRSIANVTSVHHVLFSGFNGILDLEPLHVLPYLVKITFTSLEGKQLLNLDACQMLQELTLDLYKSPDLWLPSTETVKSLTIAHSKVLESLEGIDRFSGIEKVTLIDCNRLISIHQLAMLPRLRTIDMRDCYKVSHGSISVVEEVLLHRSQQERYSQGM
jgi:NACHT domain